MGGVRVEEISLTAQDNRSLSAVLVRPETPTRSVVFSPGTAIAKEVYLNFARSGAERGAAVLLYDYRGQGGSLKGAAKHDHADFVDWGKLDLPAAIRAMDRLYPQLAMTTIGHSAGGQILGLAENHQRCDRHAFIAVCWPYWRDKPLRFSIQELFFWFGYGQACMKLFGYVPKGGLWYGESLNPKLFTTWRRWCLSPNCVDLGGFYHDVTRPIRAFGFVDDPIATPRNVPKMLGAFSRAPREEVWFDPKDFGLRRLGHQGVFSRSSNNVWSAIWDWVVPEARGADQPASERRPKPMRVAE